VTTLAFAAVLLASAYRVGVDRLARSRRGGAPRPVVSRQPA
jgi:hypothetical protein